MLIWVGWYFCFYKSAFFNFLVFIFKFLFSKRTKQAFKVKDALKEKILNYIAVTYQFVYRF